MKIECDICKGIFRTKYRKALCPACGRKIQKQQIKRINDIEKRLKEREENDN